MTVTTLFLLIIGAGLLACAQLLLLTWRERRLHFFWLGLLVLAMLIPVWNMAAYLSAQQGNTLPEIRQVASLLPWMYGPLLWWHLTQSINKRRPRMLTWFHALPFLGQCLLSVFNIPLLHNWSTGQGHFLILVSHITAYIAAGCWYLFSRRALFFSAHATPMPSAYFGYTALIVGLLFIMLWDFWISGLAVFQYQTTLSQWTTLFLVEGSYIVILALLAPVLKWQIEVPEQKLKTTRLSDSASTSVAQMLRDAMVTERWFIDPDLNLTTLAEKVGISPHDLSEVLNHRIQQSFYEFVNQYRVELACEQLREQTQASATDIGFSCGFNSKSAFYNAFKKHVNQTPIQYRQAMLAAA